MHSTRSSLRWSALLLLIVALPEPGSATEGVWSSETVYATGYSGPHLDYQSTAAGGDLATDNAGTVVLGTGLWSSGSGYHQISGGWWSRVTALRPGGTRRALELTSRTLTPPVVAHGHGTQWGLVTWEEQSSNAALYFASVSFQPISATLGTLIRLGEGDLPHLDSDGQGRWIVAASRNGYSPSPQPLVARSVDDGTTFSALTPLPLPAGQSAAAVEALKAGGGSIWIALERTTSSLIFAVRSNSSGETWAAPVLLGTGGRPCLATDRRGNWIAVWDVTQAGTTSVTLSRSTDNGLTWSEPSVVTTTSTISSAGVATDGRDHWVIVWPGGQAVSADAGQTWQASSSPQKGYRIVSDGQGRWISAGVWSWMNIFNLTTESFVSSWSMNLFVPVSGATDWALYQ